MTLTNAPILESENLILRGPEKEDAEEVISVLSKKVEESDANAKAIISMEKDIEYMKQTLDRIERLVAE